MHVCKGEEGEGREEMSKGTSYSQNTRAHKGSTVCSAHRHQITDQNGREGERGYDFESLGWIGVGLGQVEWHW